MKKQNLTFAKAVLCLALLGCGVSASAQGDRPRPDNRREMRTRDRWHLSDDDFSLLYNKVKKASFDSNKIDLIEVACLGCYFTCSQSVRLMSLFSFDNKKLEVLQKLAPRITDLHNAVQIYDSFSFSSSKDKAMRVIQQSR